MKSTSQLLAFTSLLISSIEAHPARSSDILFPRAGKAVVVQNFDDFDSAADRQPKIAKITGNVGLTDGKFPSFCVNTAKAQRSKDDTRPNCAPDQIEANSITYDDCSQPWILCRCKDAQFSATEVADAFGRIPPAIRARVPHMMALEGNQGSGASAGDRFIITGRTHAAAFAHEAFHSSDKGFSAGSTFQNAYNADSCVPDNYANSAPPEDFAQLGVWLDYDINGQPISNWLKNDQSCMKNQLAAMKTYIGDKIDVKKTPKCGDRAPNDPMVSPAGVKKVGETRDVDAEDVEEVAPGPIEWEFIDMF